MDRLLSEVAVRCDDIEFKDFVESEYERALHRANRVIAKRYSLLTKVYSFKLSDMASDIDSDMVLDLPDMKSENIVWVNGIRMVKRSNDLVDGWDAYSYYLDYRMDKWYFNYKTAVGMTPSNVDITDIDISTVMSTALTERESGSESSSKSMNDEITISYTVIPDKDTDEGDYIIPSNYEEEQIDEAIIYMARIGIARFKEDKLKKYDRIFKMHYKSDDYNKFNVPSREWVEIKPFIFP